MKERVVDTQYDPLVWLGNKIPRRSAVAANRALSNGDLTAGRAARARPAAREAHRPRRRCSHSATPCARRAASPRPPRSTRTLVENAGRARSARLDALSAHVFVLLCAVEAGQLDLRARRGRDLLDDAAGAAAGQHRHHPGRRARPAPPGARPARRGGGARPRGDRVGPRPPDPCRRPRHARPRRWPRSARARRPRPRCVRPSRCGRTTRACRRHGPPSTRWAPPPPNPPHRPPPVARHPRPSGSRRPRRK